MAKRSGCSAALHCRQPTAALIRVLMASNPRPSSGRLYVGLGLGAAAIALIAAPVAGLWGVLGWQLGRLAAARKE